MRSSSNGSLRHGKPDGVPGRSKWASQQDSGPGGSGPSRGPPDSRELVPPIIHKFDSAGPELKIGAMQRPLVFTRLGRLPFLIAGILSLILGIWGGLIRVPVNVPLPVTHANWLTFHGPLMVCGFLGTVISLERAVGLRSMWTYGAPLLTAAGAFWILFGGLGTTGPLLILAGSAWFVAVSIRVVFLSRALFTVVMSTGAVTWLVSNGLWVAGWDLNRLVPWWIAFLALTIIGERLDLTRFQKPVRWATPSLVAVLVVFLGGVLLSTWDKARGEQVSGLGLLALALWLARFDIARRTIRQPGLPRFMAVCLLSGYAWMGLSGALLLTFAPLEAGLRYDAVLHTFFVGFVFSMIFGHAPVIFPSVLQLPSAFFPRFYLHVALLHAALVLRVWGDLAGNQPVRAWGTILNSAAIGLFLLNTVTGIFQAYFIQRPKSASRMASDSRRGT